jgi:hypothetical protein
VAWFFLVALLVFSDNPIHCERSPLPVRICITESESIQHLVDGLQGTLQRVKPGQRIPVPPALHLNTIDGIPAHVRLPCPAYRYLLEPFRGVQACDT